jgi:hypothetical protein
MLTLVLQRKPTVDTASFDFGFLFVNSLKSVEPQCQVTLE